ncbi:MAG: zinc-dependent alcohol dehydrogenase, partial [Acidimicrobiales bacterium]
GCEARGLEPPCDACAAGHKGSCERISFGALSPGLQTGYCADTGGGWSTGLVAHESQLHRVPDSFDDEAAVMVEPTACALHAACSVPLQGSSKVIVLGAGTLGLLTVAALRAFALVGTLVTVAKHGVQRELALELGSDQVVVPGELKRAARRVAGSLALGSGPGGKIERLSGGVDVVFDCVGSAASLRDALSVVRPGGDVVLVGMPGPMTIDLAPLWQREIRLRGAYAYGTEERNGSLRPTFDLAIELVESAKLGRLVSASYRLDNYEEAIAHAAAAGRRGSVKIVFDLRRPRPLGGRAEAGKGEEP